MELVHYNGTRKLVIIETQDDDGLLAFFPGNAPGHTVWLDADKVMTLGVELVKWAKTKGVKMPPENVNPFRNPDL